MYARKLSDSPLLYEIDVIGSDDDTLLRISKELMLNLSLEEMQRVRGFFAGLGRNPTDVEMQAIAQAWSEHCSYKSSKPILQKFIFGIEAPQNILVIKEDAGVVEFDENHAYVVALESHNHPSAIEPYGGAATGIGGILRDVACMGAQPIALVDPLFFGPLDVEHSKLPTNVNHPKFLFGGVVSGIRDYGNRVGVPTVAGLVYFNEGFTGNCLVNVGCVGIVRKDRIVRSRAGRPNSYFILAGGKTGRDGIHGVTFASADLDTQKVDEVRSAVQLGDPITKEPLIHACLEAVEHGIVEGMKDCGGGGLSSAVGEMAFAGGYGAEIHLEKVPLKEKNMAPWEIWVSESQERMVLVVAPENINDIMAIFGKWDVEATIIGRVIEDKNIRVLYDGVVVLDMPLVFYTKGVEYKRPFVLPKTVEKYDVWEEPENYAEIILNLLSSPNIASKEWVIRQYDHEVGGNTVIKPLHGKPGSYTHGDAAVLKPLEHSNRGLAVTTAVTPSFVRLNPYWGACSALDEACRNLVAVGARPHSFADCLNFGNPEKPDRLGYFYEAARGLGDLAKYLGVPFVSGNVSFYNESELGPIPPTPTIMACGIVDDVRKCLTADFKKEGNLVYIVGETKRELGGSEYASLLKIKENIVPKVEFKILKKSIQAILKAISLRLLSSCHDISHGGLAIAIAEMCIGGDIGAEIDLSNMRIAPATTSAATSSAARRTSAHASARARTDIKLFSESNTRWVVEVPPSHAQKFEKVMQGLPLYKVGTIKGRQLVFKDHARIIKCNVSDLRRAWGETLRRLMG